MVPVQATENNRFHCQLADSAMTLSLSLSLSLSTHTELKAFLRCSTGSPCHMGSVAYVVISPEEMAFSFSTCGSQLTISSLIEDEDAFEACLKAVIEGRTFTMS